MKTHTKKPIAAVVGALLISAFNANSAKADATGGADGLVYNNRASIHSIQGAPNPIDDLKIQNAEIVYMDKAYGPAVYSYPANVAQQSTAFNVHYVNTAYGPAIYSYPNNNPQHRLDLVDNANDLDRQFVTPVSAKISRPQ